MSAPLFRSYRIICLEIHWLESMMWKIKFALQELVGIIFFSWFRHLKLVSSPNSSILGLLWRVHKATKKSTKQEAAVFVFEKKQLEKLGSKDDREQILEIMKKAVVQLTKIRHPHILTMQHPLEESRDSLAFATEPVFASLANILGNVRWLITPSQLRNRSDTFLFLLVYEFGQPK